MPPLDRPIHEAEFVALFHDLAGELRARGVTETIVLAGGAYMTFLKLREATADADSITILSGQVKEAAAAVADRHGLKPTWLNDNAAAFAPPGAAAQPTYTFFDDESLRIEGPHPDTVFLMKVAASRSATSDRSDAIALWRSCTFESTQAVVDRFYEAYPHEEFDPFFLDFVAGIAEQAAS